MTRPKDLKTVIAFVGALVIFGAIAITTYRSTRRALDDDRWVVHTYRVMEQLQDVRTATLDAESAVRGYVITGQDSFLEAHARAVEHVPQLLAELEPLTEDNPDQQARLRALKPIVDARLGLLSDQVNARRLGDAGAAGAVVGSGTDTSQMDSIRAAIARMDEEEQALLTERLARNARSQQIAVVTILAGNMAGFVLLAGAVSVIYRENRRRRDAEQEALAGRTRLDLILTSMGEGLIAADAHGTVTLFNPAAENLLGMGASSVLSESWAPHYGALRADRVTPYRTDELPLVRALRGEACQDVEIFVRNDKRREGVLLSVTGRPIRSPGGDVLGGVIVLNDITDRKRFEDEISRKNEELAHAYTELDRTRQQQLQTKDQLLSHVSHELRTPLTAAYQFVEILRDGVAGDLQPEQREYADIVLRNLKQLRSMIGDLLDATRVESAKLAVQPVRMNLAVIVRDVCRTLLSPAAEKGLYIDNRIGSIPDVLADPDRVRQVFTNLVHNAIKFTREGHITIDARLTDDARALDVTVADTGCGMTAEDADRVFNRLYQAGAQRAESRQGLGLGLYICKDLVTRQGGSIWVESERGKGSTFHCTFPLFDQDTGAAQEAQNET